MSSKVAKNRHFFNFNFRTLREYCKTKENLPQWASFETMVAGDGFLSLDILHMSAAGQP